MGNLDDDNDVKRFETKWQREERERAERKQTCRSQRRIVSYTFNYPLEQTKAKVIKFLNYSKNVPNSASKALAAGSPQKPTRQRANSQENILQSHEPEAKSSILDNNLMGYPKRQSREPLSQFVCHGLKEFNSDTQSEDSMDAEMNKQMQLEKEQKAEETAQIENKEHDITNEMQPMSISLYRQYLDWFTDNELMRVKPQTARLMLAPTVEVAGLLSSQEKQGKESAKPLESENTTKAESMKKNRVVDSPRSPRFNNFDDDDKSQKHNSDAKMTESIKDSVNDTSEENQAMQDQQMEQDDDQEVIANINKEISREELKQSLANQKQPTEPASEDQQSSEGMHDTQNLI